MGGALAPYSAAVLHTASAELHAARVWCESKTGRSRKQDSRRFRRGRLPEFRERLIATEMDRRLLERTVELAKKTTGIDAKNEDARPAPR